MAFKNNQKSNQLNDICQMQVGLNDNNQCYSLKIGTKLEDWPFCIIANINSSGKSKSSIISFIEKNEKINHFVNYIHNHFLYVTSVYPKGDIDIHIYIYEKLCLMNIV